MIARSKAFLASRGRGAIFTNLDAVTYWSLLPHVRMLIGNSSSGIMETPSFQLPTVNIGMRQQGRERARNVLDAAADKTSILKTIDTARTAEFRHSLAGMANPYGDGHASERIVQVLTSVPLTPELLVKAPCPTAQCRGLRCPNECFVRIPLSAPDIQQEDIDAVAAVLRTPRLSLGPKLEEFEYAIARYTGAAHAVGVSSGTAGLHLCIRALGIGEGDEVIVPSFAFIAVANAVALRKSASRVC